VGELLRALTARAGAECALHHAAVAALTPRPPPWCEGRYGGDGGSDAVGGGGAGSAEGGGEAWPPGAAALLPHWRRSDGKHATLLASTLALGVHVPVGAGVAGAGPMSAWPELEAVVGVVDEVVPGVASAVARSTAGTG
jgi:hypothetical protein